MWRVLMFLLGFGLALVPARASATPHVPAGDEVIVETLPVSYDPALSALAPLRQQVQRHPTELISAVPLVRAYIEAARRNGDPRFLGYAQATLTAWTEGATVPIEIRVLRATILQSLHQFEPALRELDAVLAVQPNHAQALLTRATILMVRGRYPEAQHDCGVMWRSAGLVHSALCLASVASLTGKSSTALALSQRALADAPPSEVALRLWAYTLMAETAMRAGDVAHADEYYRAAMRVDGTDRYLRAAYCDFLLDRGQPLQVLALTAELTRDDNLLLRRALALQALSRSTATGGSGPQQLASVVSQLRERHAAALLRADRTHMREAARMTLFLLHQPDAALQLARDNWAVQKEPADARILLEAALAAHDAAAQAQIAAWLLSTGLTDVQLAGMLHT